MSIGDTKSLLITSGMLAFFVIAAPLPAHAATCTSASLPCATATSDIAGMEFNVTPAGTSNTQTFTMTPYGIFLVPNGITSTANTNLFLGAGGASSPSGLTITPGGNVGIGTANPAYLLDLHTNGSTWLDLSGPFSSDYQDGIVFSSPTTGPLGYMFFNGSTNDVVMEQYYGDGGLAFYTTHNGNHSERMYIGENGNVGIGTIVPQAQLDVDGGVRVGNDSSSCTSANAGTARWTGTSFEVCDGAQWGNATHPQVQSVSATLPYGAVTHYVDCPSGYLEISCNSIEVPSGQFVCETQSDRAPGGGVGARGRSWSPAGVAGAVRRPRRAA